MFVLWGREAGNEMICSIYVQGTNKEQKKSAVMESVKKSNPVLFGCRGYFETVALTDESAVQMNRLLSWIYRFHSLARPSHIVSCYSSCGADQRKL